MKFYYLDEMRSIAHLNAIVILACQAIILCNSELRLKTYRNLTGFILPQFFFEQHQAKLAGISLTGLKNRLLLVYSYST